MTDVTPVYIGWDARGAVIVRPFPFRGPIRYPVPVRALSTARFESAGDLGAAVADAERVVLDLEIR